MGLLGMMARTAVVAGTATAVSGRVARRQARRWQQKDEAQAEEQQAEYEEQAAPEQESTRPAPEAAPAGTSLGAQLQQLATLKDQGVLSEEEFAAAKAKLLGI